MKLRLPRRRVWRIAIYVVSLLLVLVAVDLILVEVRRTIHPGFETTRITAPVQPDGSIDYLMAIEAYFGQGVTPENNAAVLIVRALGRTALASNQPPDGITDRLGMSHLPEQGDYFVMYEDYCKHHSATPENDLLDLTKVTTRPAFAPVTQQWPKDNEKPLALIIEATKRPRFFIPWYGGKRNETLAETLLPYLAPLRDASRALLVRSLSRLERGDAAGFGQDVLAVHRLARLVGQGGTMIDRLVGVMMETSACHVERAAAVSGKIPADQMRGLAADLASMKDVPDLYECVNVSERFMILELLQVLARKGPARATDLLSLIPGHPFVDKSWLLCFWPIPYDQTMRTLNHFYDSAVAASQLRTYPEQKAALKLWEQEVSAVTKHNPLSKMLSPAWAIQLFLPALVTPLEKADRARMENRLTQVALGLAAFRSDHHTYPATLAELSPAYLPAVPDDFFCEKPLIYSRTANGYTLYSVGPNMRDDGGQSKAPGDDVVASYP